METLTPNQLMYAYLNGFFPMADEDGEVYWYDPDPRAIIPIDTYRPARSLRPTLNQHRFEVRIDTQFREVMRQCARPRSPGDGVWISEGLMDAYTNLHHVGKAHSIETYSQGQLAGGLYGVALGGAFFGESMFHHVPDASKVAFHYLIQILRQQRFTLLDTQFINDNVRRLGAIEISRTHYRRQLADALRQPTSFDVEKARHCLPTPKP